MDLDSITNASWKATYISFIVSIVCFILIVVLGINLNWDGNDIDSQTNKNNTALEWILITGFMGGGAVCSMAFTILILAIIANLIVGVNQKNKLT